MNVSRLQIADENKLYLRDYYNAPFSTNAILFLQFRYTIHFMDGSN